MSKGKDLAQDAAKKKNAAQASIEAEAIGEAENTLEVDSAAKWSFQRIAQYILFFGCLAFASYHCITVIFGMPVAYVHRPMHVMFAASLGFLIYPLNKKKGLRPIDLLLCIIAVLAFITPVIDADVIAERLPMIDELTNWQIFAGAAAIAIVLFLINNVVGKALTIVCVCFLLYAYFGVHMPGVLAHKGFTVLEIIDYLSFGLEGLYSSAVGVSATYIAAFIVFGTFLERCGAGELMMDLGKALTGKYRGGPAKICVVTSAFFGTISGSAAANVYATGAFTIPMMKEAGYKTNFAGAVEAASSTGGQIMPPIMGAAAFLMADMLGVPYLEICKAAIIPAFLYFASILMMVDFEAARSGLAGVPKEQLPHLKDVVKRLHLLLPIVVLVGVMVMGYTPFRAAMLASACAILVSWTDKKHAMGPWRIIQALSTSGRRMVLIAVACMGAGVVIGVVSLTGLGLNLAAVVMSVSGGYTLIALVFVMLASIIMGMGTPTTVAYVLVATLGVPALIELGFGLLPSHFFVFYFGVISMVTPPVAVAAYAGAEVAGGNMMKTAVQATKLCSVAFLVPFFFMYDDALLMQGTAPEIIQAFTTASIGSIALSASMVGWFIRVLPMWTRIIMFLAACNLIIPGTKTDLIGLVVLAALVVFCRITKNSSNVMAVQRS